MEAEIRAVDGVAIHRTPAHGLHGGPRRAGRLGYFFTRLFVDTCHEPPAFSLSAWMVYFEKSADVPDGLLAGDDVEELPEADVPGSAGSSNIQAADDSERLARELEEDFERDLTHCTAFDAGADFTRPAAHDRDLRPDHEAVGRLRGSSRRTETCCPRDR